jgi:thiol-disulfide isomerase/thioredoxin
MPAMLTSSELMTQQRPHAARRGLHALLLGAGGLLLTVAGGCMPSQVREVRDLPELQQVTAASERPALVDYYKEGCENCNAFEITLRALADEYQGQITAAKFLLLKANGECSAPEFAAKNDIQQYPTVILYVNGKETKRFVQNYKYDDYSAAITESLRTSPPRPGPAPGGRP